jgi:hypothetical protein
MAVVTSGTSPYYGVGIGTAATHTHTLAADHEANYREALLTSLRALQEIAAKDMALRTFLQVAYPDVLEQFEAAYAAQKRMGVKHASSNTP